MVAGESMGKITASIPDDLEDRLREIAIKKFGPKRGYLQKALIEAIRLWIEREEGQ